jgi:manganese/iron transport system substrate-binding protein
MLHATIRIYMLRAMMPDPFPERLCRMTDFPMLSCSISRRSLLVGAAGNVAAFSMVRGSALGQSTPVDDSRSSLGWNDDLGQDNGKLNVATTVAPISSIVRNIGGTAINLHGIVPDGTNSHTFEPAPSDAVTLSHADIVIVNGLSLETPTMDLAEANLQDGAEVFSLGDKTITEAEYKYDFSFPEDGGKPNPHLWMNVPFAIDYANLVSAELSRIDGGNAGYYAGNLARYLDVLNRLDAGIAEAVQTIPEANRKLLTYHDSWAYFADHYGMTVIGAIQPSDFSEPSPREVADLIDQIREEQVPAIFGSEVFPSPVLEQIAAESGATYIAELRDDEPPGEPGAPEHTYIGMMLKDMELMIPALGGNTGALAGIEPFDTHA